MWYKNQPNVPNIVIFFDSLVCKTFQSSVVHYGASWSAQSSSSFWCWFHMVMTKIYSIFKKSSTCKSQGIFTVDLKIVGQKLSHCNRNPCDLELCRNFVCWKSSVTAALKVTRFSCTLNTFLSLFLDKNHLNIFWGKKYFLLIKFLGSHTAWHFTTWKNCPAFLHMEYFAS